MDSGKVVLGVLAGIAIGAILGILFASAKGTEKKNM
jgi:gas vesicle protein